MTTPKKPRGVDVTLNLEAFLEELDSVLEMQGIDPDLNDPDLEDMDPELTIKLPEDKEELEKARLGLEALFEEDEEGWGEF